MNTIDKYQPLLFIIPFVLVIIAGYVLDIFSQKGRLVKFLDAIAEKDLPKLMKRAGFTKTTLFTFQLVRCIYAIVLVVIILLIGGYSAKTSLIITVVLGLGFYKLAYFYLLFKETSRISELNRQLPYCIKTISYLCYLYPVTPAIQKAKDYVPTIFRNDIKELLEDIDEDPISFKPYQKWIDKYDGRLHNMDLYLRTLYRMGASTAKEQDKLLANLNSSISNHVQRVRKQKNDAINNRISWLGMVPVGLVALMLCYLIVVIAVNF